MPQKPSPRRGFRFPWRSAAQIGAEVDEELRFHLEMRTEELERQGWDSEAARTQAWREFGDVRGARNALREMDSRQEKVRQRVEWWDAARGDLRFALRTFRKNPAFAITAVVTLALGIGAATAMFGVVNGMLLRPLPVQEQDRVMVVWMEHPGRGEFMHVPLGYTQLRQYEEQIHAFEGLAGVDYNGAWPKVIEDRGGSITANWSWVTGNLFRVLGVAPAAGRILLPEDDRVGAAPVLVISHAFWQRHFSGDPEAVGRTLRWEDRTYVIVGVMPRGFDYPKGADLWAPAIPQFPAMLDHSAGESRARMLDLVGRLRPGATPEQARADLDAYHQRTDPERPAALRGLTAVVTPLPELILGDVRPALLILAAAVALVLLLACINVANLLLIRSSARVQELAIRSALGAGRRRIIRQLLTESSLLALLGGTIGVLLSIWVMRALVVLAPPELPRLDSIRPDGKMFGVALGITMVAALLAGLAPALWTAGGNLAQSLRSGRRVGTADGRMRAVRQSLVVGQIALALLVLAGAGLLIRSLYELQRVDMGFAKEQLVVAETHLPVAKIGTRPQMLARLDHILANMEATPGVLAATPVSTRPFSGTGGIDAIYTGEGQTSEQQRTNPWINMEQAGPGYFRTLEIPILRGRGFTEQDREEAALVAVVSQATAERTWPGEDPIGKRLKLGGPEGPDSWRTVVGVVGETRYRELVTPRPTVYLPFTQFGKRSVPNDFALRISADPTAVIPAVRYALRDIDPDLALLNARTMHEHLSGPLARPRFSAVLLGALAFLALVLAAVGIYGVMAAFVRQRTHEIGVRLALGAQTDDVRRMVLRQGMVLILFGTGVGLLAALAGTRALRSVLFQVGPTDLSTLGGVAGLLCLVALAACWAPARRATRVDPLVALRAE